MADDGCSLETPTGATALPGTPDLPALRLAQRGKAKQIEGSTGQGKERGVVKKMRHRTTSPFSAAEKQLLLSAGPG